MTLRDSSPSSALFQIAMALGRMEQRQTDILTQTGHITRSLDHLIATLQKNSSSTSTQPPEPPRWPRSMLGPIAGKIAGKVSTDLIIKLLLIGVRYLLPGLWFGVGILKSLLRMMGLL